MEPMRIRPIHGLLLVLFAFGALYGADWLFEGGLRQSSFERVAPGTDGQVKIDLGSLQNGQVRFFRFLNTSNQEVKFFVGRDVHGVVQVGFDANEVCAKRKRGYRADGEWMVCRTCDKSFRLAETNSNPGGCAPVALVHRVVGTELLLAESDILAGWRLFS
jgi:uncharacterized membrane protein